jgi:hypothetical protein
MDICIDFDGTCVTHEFPKVGKEIGAAVVLKELTDHGHNLILFTMRSDSDDPNKKYLTDAVNWFKKHDIPLYGIQSNPSQTKWTTSPKAYGQLYIDDAALGCPLEQPDFDVINNRRVTYRPYVDWHEVRKILVLKGLIYKIKP